jgi:hypothetical protein
VPCGTGSRLDIICIQVGCYPEERLPCWGTAYLSQTPHEQIFSETINPPVVAFHHSLDDTNASITPGYPQKPFCHPFGPAANTHPKSEVTFGLVPQCQKKNHLATYIELGKAISLKVDDIGRRRLLTQPRPGRQLPAVSAFRVSEG